MEIGVGPVFDKPEKEILKMTNRTSSEFRRGHGAHICAQCGYNTRLYNYGYGDDVCDVCCLAGEQANVVNDECGEYKEVKAALPDMVQEQFPTVAKNAKRMEKVMEAFHAALCYPPQD